MREFADLEEVATGCGTDLGTSSWLTIAQDDIDRFADATGDHQWVHVDAARAAEGPFGTTIAHGFLTLSLIPRLAAEIYDVRGVAMSVNYGLDKVRFPAPVPVDSRIRVRSHLSTVTEVPNGIRIVVIHTVDVAGVEKPGCVAEHVRLLIRA